ncbi:hypothetical protein [Parasphingorhabdus cellanae]|uniref:Lipoprotein n=1 Tax=Parasphingorhabdus cellanae TaxID=2806553 RepID=A0ABX7SZG6_9SPHN|nr:hypothetical protein [Parasphingorhabdus cellanae]QTD54664.1 hypothetical protein J4G78_10350 [Parasphingorhabdus cellanae]
MTHLSRSLLLAATAFTLPLTMAACGSNEGNEAELAELDDNLTADPAMKDALEDQILVDPNLTDQANNNAIRGANGPIDGKVPPEGGKAYATAQLEGKMLSAPKPRNMTSDDECTSCAGSEGITLGAKAQAQRGKGTCDQKLSYDMGWANRMPPEFPVYPKANVKEAAGVEGGLCDIRVVSFSTASPMKNVVDYYYTQAKRGGYSAEYLLRGSEHVLGGTRGNDDGAYVITLNSRSGGGTVVDIVASNGR